MITYIDELKRKQDEEDFLKEECLQMFLPFRDAFIEKLREFVAEATAKGLHGVAEVRQEAASGGSLKVTTKLDGHNLVLICGGEATLRDREAVDTRIYASKMMIYWRDDPSTVPWMEVCVQRIDKDKYSYYINMIKEKLIPLHASHRQPKIDRTDGAQAAMKVIECYYSFTSVWRASPTVAMMVGGNSKGPIGFPTS